MLKKIILDTNVLVSALLKAHSNPALILSLAIERKVQLCLSDDIFSEYKEVLAYGKFKNLDQNNVKALLNKLKEDALLFIPRAPVNIIKNHQADNKFLECALAAEADFVITGNRKHFNFKTFHHIQILTPTEFLFIIAKTLFI